MTVFADAVISGFVRTESLAGDVRRHLVDRGLTGTASHSAEVADRAAALARRFGSDAARATTAAWLHDIGAVIPNAQRLAAATEWGLEIVEEERALPMLLHQKLSAVIADKAMGIQDAGVLNAVRYHTTLHPEADALAKVVFTADKIAWDQQGRPPYADDLIAALEISLDAGVRVYLHYLWDQQPVLHPWFVAAYARLCGA